MFKTLGSRHWVQDIGFLSCGVAHKVLLAKLCEGVFVWISGLQGLLASIFEFGAAKALGGHADGGLDILRELRSVCEPVHEMLGMFVGAKGWVLDEYGDHRRVGIHNAFDFGDGPVSIIAGGLAGLFCLFEHIGFDGFDLKFVALVIDGASRDAVVAHFGLRDILWVEAA